MINKILIPATIALTLGMVGCASLPNTANTAENLAALQQKDWILTQIDQVEYKIDPAVKNAPSLRFDNLALSGADGCNRIMGGYAVQGTKLTFSQLAKTQMMCMNATDLEQKFSQSLERVAGYQVKKNELELFDSNNKVIMKFKTTPAK